MTISNRDNFCGMAHSPGSRRRQKDDSDSDSEDEVRDELSPLRQENDELVALLDNYDSMLREAKKLKKELRAFLEKTKEKVTDLESKNLDAKLEIDSLNAALAVTDEIDYGDCTVFLADLTVLRDKHASMLEELDMVRAELDELKSKPASLGACTSCPVLHGKLDESRARIVSLEAALNLFLPLLILLVRVHVVKNLELVHYVDPLQDENDELRKLMGWLSGHEPQLEMIIAEFKRFQSGTWVLESWRVQW
jgi:DNA repair exonuclease SbcCD ATPase subunit